MCSDFNGDGALDVVFTNQGSPSTILLNNGTGGLAPPALVASSSLGSDDHTRGVAVGDVNGDGAVDMVLCGESNALFLNDGEGVFSEDVNVPLPSDGRACSFVDMDRDGALDILLLLGTTAGDRGSGGDGESGGGPLALFVSKGNRPPSSPACALGNVVCTLLEDETAIFGLTDISGDWSFYDPTAMALADVDLNGILDVIITVALPSSGSFYDGSTLPVVVYGEQNLTTGKLLYGDDCRSGNDCACTNYGWNRDSSFGGLSSSSLVVADFENRGLTDVVIGSGLAFGNGKNEMLGYRQICEEEGDDGIRSKWGDSDGNSIALYDLDDIESICAFRDIFFNPDPNPDFPYCTLACGEEEEPCEQCFEKQECSDCPIEVQCVTDETEPDLDKVSCAARCVQKFTIERFDVRALASTDVDGDGDIDLFYAMGSKSSPAALRRTNRMAAPPV